MQYDPIKRTLGAFFNSAPWLRILFYKMLDLLLLRTWHIKRELKVLEKELPKATQVLDAGSGYGQYTYALARLNTSWKIKSVDIKQEQIDDCNSFFEKINLNNRVHFEFQDLTQYVIPNAFNLILSVDVMEHIEDDRGVFRNFYKSLVKGGILLISTPSDQGGSDAHDHEDSSFIEEHVRNGYGKEDIIQKLTEAGFSKIEVKYSYGTPGKLSWRLSMKYPIQTLNFTKLLLVLLPFYYILIFPFCLILNYFDTKGTHSTGTGLIVKAQKT